MDRTFDSRATSYISSSFSNMAPHDPSPSSPPQVLYMTPNHRITKAQYVAGSDPRGYVLVYEYPLNGQWIMMDANDGYVFWTGIWKALGNSKDGVVEILESQLDLTGKLRTVSSGHLKMQGAWVACDVARELARRVAWNIRHDLMPLFGPTFPDSCLSPDQPGYGTLVTRSSSKTRRSKRSGQPLPTGASSQLPFAKRQRGIGTNEYQVPDQHIYNKPPRGPSAHHTIPHQPRHLRTTPYYGINMPVQYSPISQAITVPRVPAPKPKNSSSRFSNNLLKDFMKMLNNSAVDFSNQLDILQGGSFTPSIPVNHSSALTVGNLAPQPYIDPSDYQSVEEPPHSNAPLVKPQPESQAAEPQNSELPDLSQSKFLIADSFLEGKLQLDRERQRWEGERTQPDAQGLIEAPSHQGHGAVPHITDLYGTSELPVEASTMTPLSQSSITQEQSALPEAPWSVSATEQNSIFDKRQGVPARAVDRTQATGYEVPNFGHGLEIVQVHGEVTLPSKDNSRHDDIEFLHGFTESGSPDKTRVAESCEESTLKAVPISRQMHAARELHTWGKCTHPNILPLYGLAAFRGRIGMVSPWMGQGNLPNYLKQHPGVDRYHMCIQICDGLAYLHQTGIIHGDLKGANILISDDGTPVLTDFGNSLYSNQTMKFTETTSTHSLTVRWSAPELILESGVPTEASDIYALAMTFYEVLTGTLPYEGTGEPRIMYLVTNKQTPERTKAIPSGQSEGDTIWDLFLRCWAFDPKARPSAREVANIMEAVAQPKSSYSRKAITCETYGEVVRADLPEDYVNERTNQ